MAIFRYFLVLIVFDKYSILHKVNAIPAIPAGNSDSSFMEKECDSSVSSRGAIKESVVKNSSRSVKLETDSTKEAVLTNSVSAISAPAGIAVNMYREIPSIAAKDEFEMRLTESLMNGKTDTGVFEGAQEFLRNLAGYYLIMEGIFFYSGFVMILSFHRRNLMPGIGEQFQYILRDETIHLNFGIDLINGIKEENPKLWTEEFKQEIIQLVRHAVELEIAYAYDCLPVGVMGLNGELFRDYVGHIADRRLERIDLPAQYGTRNPFPWMSETMDLTKEKNFFETRVTEYQSAAVLQWD